MRPETQRSHGMRHTPDTAHEGNGQHANTHSTNDTKHTPSTHVVASRDTQQKTPSTAAPCTPQVALRPASHSDRTTERLPVATASERRSTVRVCGCVGGWACGTARPLASAARPPVWWQVSARRVLLARADRDMLLMKLPATAAHACARGCRHRGHVDDGCTPCLQPDDGRKHEGRATTTATADTDTATPATPATSVPTPSDPCNVAATHQGRSPRERVPARRTQHGWCCPRQRRCALC